MTSPNPNTVWAETFVDELVRAGVRDIVLAPGARSIPLVLACAARSEMHMYTHIDERAAAFFALGLSKGSGRIPAMLTTSGTATANLYPAVIEAALGCTALLVLTADRPGHLRLTDANQTIDQQRLYGDYTRAFFDAGPPQLDDSRLRAHRSLAARAVAAAHGPPAGPAQVNFPFAQPLEPTGTRVPDAPGRRSAGTIVHRTEAVADAATLGTLAEHLGRAVRALLIAGPTTNPSATGPAIVKLAERAAIPLLADPLSGARFAPGASRASLCAYDAYLELPECQSPLAPDLIVRFGATPTSSGLAAFLEYHAGVPHVVVDDGHRWADHLALATEYIRANPERVATELASRGQWSGEGSWRRRWQEIDCCARDVLAAGGRDAPDEPHVAGRLAAALAAETPFVVGNSMPIRDLDRYGAAREAALRVMGNRGASGIDGLVSTAAGVAAGANRPTVALVGDLSFLHDLGGLFALRQHRPPLVLVVVNNDGGGIFDTLPVRTFEPAFTRHIVVPHGLELARAAALFELPHRLVDVHGDVAGEVGTALEQQAPAIIEVRTDRKRALRQREQDQHAVALAVSATLHAGDTHQ